MRIRAPRALRFGIPALGAMLLAGCASPASGDAVGGPVSIVASTSVYGSLAEAVVGDAAEVTSIIVRANQDPHGYEATARDQLSLSRADLVIQNGGGYDPFVAELLETSGNDPVVLTAVEDDVHGEADHGEADHDEADHDEADHDEADHDEAVHDEAVHGEAVHDDAHDDAEDEHAHVHGENEHVWYSLHAMHELTVELGEALAALDPEHADTYLSNASRLAADIEALESRAAELSDAGAGVTALATEPVPLPLLADLGIDDRTPVEFLAAIEDARDVPPAVLDAALDLLASGEIDLVAFNEQTVDATSTRLLDDATASGVPVVHFSELPPEGTGYVDWMAGNLDRLAEVLG